MAILVVFEFKFDGPWGEEMTRGLGGMALSIAEEPGLVWKMWTGAPERNVAGGVYLFETKDHAKTYTEKHSVRLKHLGVTDITVLSYAVNEALSVITRGR